MHCIKNECFVQRLIGYLWKVHLQSACIDTEPFITLIIFPCLSFVFCVVHPHNVRFQNVRKVQFSNPPVLKHDILKPDVLWVYLLCTSFGLWTICVAKTQAFDLQLSFSFLTPPEYHKEGIVCRYWFLSVAYCTWMVYDLDTCNRWDLVKGLCHGMVLTFFWKGLDRVAFYFHIFICQILLRFFYKQKSFSPR